MKVLTIIGARPQFVKVVAYLRGILRLKKLFDTQVNISLLVLAIGASLSFSSNSRVPDQSWIGVLSKIILIVLLIGIVSLIAIPKLKSKSTSFATA